MLNALKQLWTRSITRQLMLGIALVHAVMMTIFVFDLVERQRTFLVTESAKQAVSLAETLAANGTSWVLSRDFIGIEEVIESQNKYPGLRYAMFTDLEGRVLGYTDRSEVGRFLGDPISRRLLKAVPATLTLMETPLLVDVAHPVMTHGRHIGWARVGISRASIAANLALVTREGLLYTFAAIGIGIIFAWFMARSLTRDIRHLAAFSNRIRAGTRDDLLTVDRVDELGYLAVAMEQMRDQLALREQELQEAHQQLHDKEERFRFALDGSSDGLWDWDIASGEVYYSPRWKEMLGYKEDELQNSFQTWHNLIHPDDAEEAARKVEQHLADPRHPFEIRHRLRHKEGSWRWILSRGRALRDPVSGFPLRMVGTHVDISEQKRLEQVLVEEREKAQVTLSSIGDGVITTDAHGQVEFLNPVACELTGWSSEEAKGRPLAKVFPIVDELSHKPVANPVGRCLREGRVVVMSGHNLLINRNGKEISIEDSAAPIHNNTGQVMGAVFVFHDVSEARQLQRQLEHQALHDDLTGLWNRRAFEQKLSELVSEARQGEGEHTLVYIDLDQFKVINDTVGHLAGDELLKQVATLLRKEILQSDFLARLGGDEFGLLLVECPLQLATLRSERLRKRLIEVPFTWASKSFQIAASFGLTAINAELPDGNALALADLACYGAKEQGRNQVHVYHPNDQELADRRNEMDWVGRLKNALDEERLLLYCQRIQPLRKCPEGESPLMQELLIRMRDEEGRLVMPHQFIPAAERYAIMHQIDLWVIEHVCAWLRRIDDQRTCFFINLSGSSLGNPSVVEAIEAQLRENRSLCTRFCFEISESAAISNLAKTAAFMEQLKERGARFSLDDFGGGLSSFTYLKKLPVDFIKIDGSFIRSLLDDPVDAAMVESIAHISRQMNIQTVAEFVESEAILKRLAEMGVDHAQGYAIERPHPLH